MLPPREDRSGGGSDYGREIPAEDLDAQAGRGASSGASLLGFSGSSLRMIGIILVAIGFMAFIGAVAYAMTGPSLPQAGQSSQDWWQESSARMLGAFVIGAIGMGCFAIGGWALRFGLVRPVTSYVAEEASPAIETAASAVGRGLSGTNLGAALRAQPQVETIVKVKCKHCGYLDSEDATYCSKCGQPL